MPRKYKQGRRKARTAWDTYSEWYDKLAKKNPDMFHPKMTKTEFELKLELAKDAGIKNPSREIARSQRKWEYQMARRYKKQTGRELTGRETKEERQEIFIEFSNMFDSLQDAREAFEALY